MWPGPAYRGPRLWTSPAHARILIRRTSPLMQIQYVTQARSLRTDILEAPTVWLPRREILLDWLNAFLQRAEKPKYELGETEASDLVALDHFLRRKKVPVAP